MTTTLATTITTMMMMKKMKYSDLICKYFLTNVATVIMTAKYEYAKLFVTTLAFKHTKR